MARPAPTRDDAPSNWVRALALLVLAGLALADALVPDFDPFPSWGYVAYVLGVLWGDRVTPSLVRPGK